jgi:hypothetical protein
MNLVFTKFLPKSWVSRSKTLLKRRKLAVKHRTISGKKLKEEAKRFSYAKEYKALQIQKELDRRSYPSQHINELMDQIFYPDVSLAEEQAAKLHIQASHLHEYQDFQDQGSLSQAQKQINKIVLATELIDLYNQSGALMTIRECVALFKKIADYFKKRERIKEKVEEGWARMNQSMKRKDKNYKEKKCPFIFIDKEDTFHYKPWYEMIDHFVSRMQSKLQEEEDVVWSVLGLAEIIELTYMGVNYIPLKLFDVFNTYLSRLSEEGVKKLSVGEADQLLRTINLQNFVRFATHTVIPNEEKQEEINSTNLKINSMRAAIILKLLADPKVTSYEISTVIKTLKYGIVLINEEIEKSLRARVIENMSEFPFEKVVDLLIIYLKNGIIADMEFMVLLKFDVLRKSTNAVSKKHLFKCVEAVVKRQLYFGSAMINKSETL